MQCCRCSLSLHLCVHMLCTFCVHAAHVCCVWGKPTKGVRTIDSFRVNGLNGWLQEDFTDSKYALQSRGYYFVHCLRNNLSFWFWEPLCQLCLLKRYPESTLLVLQQDIVWLRFFL